MIHRRYFRSWAGHEFTVVDMDGDKVPRLANEPRENETSFENQGHPPNVQRILTVGSANGALHRIILICIHSFLADDGNPAWLCLTVGRSSEVGSRSSLKCVSAAILLCVSR